MARFFIHGGAAEGAVEETMMSSQAGKAQYRVTQRGREHAIRSMEVSP